jgi:RNA polymerase sigma factor (sigma-70 family)
MVVVSGEVRLPRLLRREAGVEVDRLYRRHSGEILRYAQLVLRSRSDAEDITQTVFMRALRAIERGEKVRAPRNWLIKIAHNECRRLLATRKLHAELPDEIAVEPVEQGRADELRRAMAALPETQRRALVLRELEGRSYTEIATSLDLSVSAIETLIFRARRALREQLENGLSCEEFVALLEDPAARARVRAHARVCADCATLDHRSRGRKSALKRIASGLGLPGWGTWWGAKVAAVAVTAVAGVAAVSVPHAAVRHAAVAPEFPPVVVHLSPQARASLSSRTPQQAPARAVVAAATLSGAAPVSDAPTASPVAATSLPAVLPGPAEPAPVPPTEPQPEAPAPPPLPSPTKIVPPEAPQPVSEPVLSVAQAVLPFLPELPAATVPPVGLPLPALELPELPTVTIAVATPKVSLP